MLSKKIRLIACAISGGVDSAVSCHILKSKGYEVVGVFMRNWDIENEKGICTADKDKEDAKYVCDFLKVPFIETNFVKQYWNDVFSYLIMSYENGMTPNPDVLCNKHIKFGSLFENVTTKLGCDALATGHYAQNSAGNFLENIDSMTDNVKLLMAKDKWKDQTLFLSQIPQHALKRTMFPVGNLFKKDVKEIARSVGLDKIVNKRESMGICFVGKRNFSDFIEEYIAPKPGVFIDVDTGKVVGEHKGTHYWTIGQRSLLGGFSKGYFIQKIDAKTQEIFVASGTNHPSLFSDTMYTASPHWIGDVPTKLQTTNTLYNCQFKFQHVFKRSDCSMQFCDTQPSELSIVTNRPTRALTPGQFATFYNGEECLGSAMIKSVGPSLFDLNKRSQAMDYDEYEQSFCDNRPEQIAKKVI